MFKFATRVLIASLLGVGVMYGQEQLVTVHAENATETSSNQQNDYYKVAPKAVVLTEDGYIYSSPNLDVASEKTKISKGTILEVSSIAYSNTDLPCLKVDGGYISAAKSLSVESSESEKGNTITTESSSESSNVLDSSSEKNSAAGIDSDKRESENLLKHESDKKLGPSNADTNDQVKVETSKTMQSRAVAARSAVDLSKYYTTNSGQIVALTDIKQYSEVGLKNVIKTISAGSLLKTQGVEYASGYPRFKVSGGYITANRSFVIQPTSNIANYYTTNTGQIVALTDIKVYSEVGLKTVVRTVTAGNLLKTQGVEYAGGYPRFKVSDGYITANKSYVVQPTSNIANYYTTNTGQIAALSDIHVYSDVALTKLVKTVSAGTLLKVQGVEYIGGYPRYKLSNGYITTNKSFVVQPVSSISNYYTTNPGQISALKTTHLYSDINLKNIVKKVSAGTVYQVQKIQYSTSGYPRFKVAGGFISANKSIVATYKGSSTTEKANKVIALAKTKLGDPYTQSASGRLGPNSFDCSGFVYYIYKTALGIVLPGTTTTTEEPAGKEVSLNALKPGDLLFYGTRGNTYHVGIYEGNGIMIHAATPEEGVRETAIKYYEPSFARRILN